MQKSLAQLRAQSSPSVVAPVLFAALAPLALSALASLSAVLVFAVPLLAVELAPLANSAQLSALAQQSELLLLPVVSSLCGPARYLLAHFAAFHPLAQLSPSVALRPHSYSPAHFVP